MRRRPRTPAALPREPGHTDHGCRAGLVPREGVPGVWDRCVWCACTPQRLERVPVTERPFETVTWPAR